MKQYFLKIFSLLLAKGNIQAYFAKKCVTYLNTWGFDMKLDSFFTLKRLYSFLIAIDFYFSVERVEKVLCDVLTH